MTMAKAILSACKNFIGYIKSQIKQITRPASHTVIGGALADLPRSRADLLAENAFLRQQLSVLKRGTKRPRLTNGDRGRLVFLARLTRLWRSALHIVQPDTVLRWHRDLFRRYWKRKSKSKVGRQRLPQEIIDLIKQLARENPRWGAKKIQGELLKLDIAVHKSTIQKYIRQGRKRKSGQQWGTFLKNHAGDIWACDFTVVHDLLFRPLYIFVIIEHQTRRIVHAAVTRSPTDDWTAQQLREATAWGKRPRFLLRDNDGKYGSHFAAVASGIEVLKTPIRAPRANAICERFLGTLKRECLDHILVLNWKHLQRVLTEFVNYYNEARPHQGIQQRIPAWYVAGIPSSTNKRVKGSVVSVPVLGGLHHRYAYSVSYLH